MAFSLNTPSMSIAFVAKNSSEKKLFMRVDTVDLNSSFLIEMRSWAGRDIEGRALTMMSSTKESARDVKMSSR